MALRGPTMAPRGPKMASRWTPKTMKNLRKMHVFAFPKHLDSKMAPRWFKDGRDGPQDEPRRPQDGPGWTQDGPYP